MEMKKLSWVKFLVSCGVVLSVLSACGGTPTPATSVPEASVSPLTEDLLKNATYALDGVQESTFQLVEGAYEHQYGDGATMVDTVGLSHTALGDLDGDGVGDAAVVLWHHSGGTGVFVTLVAMRNEAGEPQQVAAAFIGDRAQVESVSIVDGQILLEMVTHGPDDPMCCPSQHIKQAYQLVDGTLNLVAEEGAEGPGDDGSVSVGESDEDVAETALITYLPELPDATQEGSCWTTSIAAFGREDAWRCMVENSIYDPCFQLDDGTVVCGADPVTGEVGFQLVLTEPLPESDLPADAVPSAWMVVLADGTFCSRATGTMGFVDEKPTTFYCASDDPDETVVLLDELQPGTPWMAERAVLGNGPEISATDVALVPIRTLYQ